MIGAPPDQHVRTKIESDLKTNYLVEAGAGSGKTTALVGRMVALVKDGVPVEEIAAVTFTRKAAAELRERFQARIEDELRNVDPSSELSGRLSSAVRDVERGFLGTVHAFCARLLRERPLEAGIDPAFEEMMEAEHERYLSDFWRIDLDRRAAQEDPLLRAVVEAGIQTGQLRRAFDTVVENLDVGFPVEAVPPPSGESVAALRTALGALLDRGLKLLPDTKPAKGWGDLQLRVRELRYARERPDWQDDTAFLSALSQLASWTPKVTLNRWGSSKLVQSQAKELKGAFEEFLGDLGVVAVVDQWWASRYAPAMELLLAMATAFATERRRTGRLSFQDLLSLTANLLRTHPGARRHLGHRYARLLIDEFQDTDPIQAEIAFLLASDPTPGDKGPADWTTVTPRPGALFMVGDPKQSIYRFRRADIAVYSSVRNRMSEIGEVVSLIANFRSLLSVAGIVNEVFGDAFPDEPTDVQAPYASLMAQRSDEGVDTQGVFTYTLDGRWHFTDETAWDEAQRLASWIRRRVDAGERSPGDFLILTARKRHLHLYAHALEAHNLSVDVAGAQIEIERGLGELLGVLEALIDPANPVPTVATLTGLFFGLDHDALLDHRLAGGGFDCRVAGEGPAGPVRDALERISGWWYSSLHAPSDVFITRLVDDLGVLADAAASELGGIRTGALLYALDTVRTAATGGDTSLVGAVQALRTGIGWGDAETPLEPGRTDAVRVMNLHKAKGLESKVVVLAGPGGSSTSTADFHVSRDDAGRAVGHLKVSMGRWGGQVIAQPLGWREYAAREDAFLEAERIRLRYVAATRAADELVVGVREKGSPSPWAILEPWLAKNAPRLDDFDIIAAAPPEVPEITPAMIAAKVREADDVRAYLAKPTYVVNTVTSLAKAIDAPAEELDPQAVHDKRVQPWPSESAIPGEHPRGFEWGSVVHAALAASARGTTGPEWVGLCRALLVDYGRPISNDGEPTELQALVDLVVSVQASALWVRATKAPAMLVEAPFAAVVGRNPDHLVEGVIDLAFKDATGWVLVDYKTDVGDDVDFAARSSGYRTQVDLYAQAWTQLTGEPVVEKVLLFTTQGRQEGW